MKTGICCNIGFLDFGCVRPQWQRLPTLGDPAPRSKTGGGTKKTGKNVKVEASACAASMYGPAGEVNIYVSTHEGAEPFFEGTAHTMVAKAPTVVLVNRNNPVNDPKLQPHTFAGRSGTEGSFGNDRIKNVLLQPRPPFFQEHSPVWQGHQAADA